MSNPGGTSRTRELLRVARHPDLRRVEAAYGMFSIAECGTWIAVIVYAFERGGVAEAGAITLLQYAPAVVVAPFAAYAGDRFRTDRVVAIGYATQAVAMLATAASMWADSSVVLIYGAATVSSVALTFTRPAIGALLPATTETPADLTAANVTLGILENLGAFVGPALAGVLMSGSGDPALVFAVMGVGMAAAALAMTGLHLDRAMVLPTESIDAGDVVNDALAGFRTLGRAPNVRLIVLVLGVGTTLAGAVDVLFVAVADELSADDPAAGAAVLAAGYGLGALLAAFGSVVFVGRSRLARPLAIGVAASGGAVALVAVLLQPAAALLLFVFAGAGQSLARIAATTLVQRVAPSALLCRVFGVMEGIDMATLALGSVGVAVLVDRLGLRPTLVVVGLGAPLAVALRAARLHHIDATTPQPRREVVRLVRAQEMFASLAPPAMERLLAGIIPVEVTAGTVVIRQGEPGDRYYLVERGELAVTVDGVPARTVGRGDGFGEIALVRDVPRTATVTAISPALLQAIERDDFLVALTGHPRGLGVATERARKLLDGDAAGIRSNDREAP